MPNHILNNHKLATLSEFRYLLLEVLNRREPVSWYDLSFSCKEHSLNLAFSFESTVAFLELLSLLHIHADRSVSRAGENYEALSTEEALGGFIFRKTIACLETEKRLDQAFNEKTIVIDPISDIIVIRVQEFPPELSFMESLLINLGVAAADKHDRQKLLVNTAHKGYFREDLFPRIFKNVTPESSQSPAAPERPYKTPTFFISYADRDKEFKNELQKHLSGLKRINLIRDWEGRAILPGQDWEDEIRQKLEQAEVVLFLVSSDFLASEYINDVEIKKTIERHSQGRVRIIPIILRPCDFDSLPIKRYQALPEGARAISLWENKDEAYLNIVNRIKDVLKQMSNQAGTQ